MWPWFSLVSECHFSFSQGPNSDNNCGIVSKPYGLDFGSCDHSGSGWCSYQVIMFGDPLGDAPSTGVLCSVYKARCSLSSIPAWEKASVPQTQITDATQQDLDNHILLGKTEVAN